jgi:sialate O-acetylesterase
MIKDWRQQFKQGDLPFLFVQISSFNWGNGNSNNGSTWAELREAQIKALGLPNTGMAVTTDIGEATNIHPKNKQEVGRRLAAIALNKVYGENVNYKGPSFSGMEIKGDSIILSFSDAESGLITNDKYGYLKGFEIAGADHAFHYASAMIENNKVVVYSKDVKGPLAVHYAWADDAGDANLYNKNGFPAVPFRTDDWVIYTKNTHYKLLDM